MTQISPCLFMPGTSNETKNKWHRDMADLGSHSRTNVDKYSCVCLLSNTNTPTAVSYCKLSPQHDIGTIKCPYETSEVKLQTSTHEIHQNVFRRMEKGVQRVFAIAVFSPSISGRRGWSLVPLPVWERIKRRKPSKPQSPSFPFKHTSI